MASLFSGVQSGFDKAVSAVKPAVQAQSQQIAARKAANVQSVTPDTIDQQTGSARALGAGLAQQGQSLFGGQQAAAGGFGAQGAAYNPTAQSVTGAPAAAAPAPGSGASMLAKAQQAAAARGINVPGQTAGGFSSALTGAAGARPIAGQAPAPAPAQPAFQTGTRATAGNMGSVSSVDPAALGAYGSVAGGLGSAPGAVSTGSLGSVGMAAGRLGGGYQVGNVGGSVAGALGGAPQVGNVGNISMGAAPGAVAGTFGNQGAQSADQAGMMARLNGFLDAPEGPSVAESQLKQAQAQNMGQMIGLARSGRGGAGAQAQALEGALSEGGAVASETAGQLATLRAQEEDMRKNRALSAIGLGGDMATAARGQDLSFRGQNLAAAQGDQSTALGARGQDLTGAMANQSTQTQLEQLRAQTALGARGQDLSALQGDQSTALGLEGLRANTAVATRGQDLSALQGDQSAQLGVRGQNLSAAQGNQSTALGARGQDLSALSADVQAQIAARGQNLGALQGNQQAQLGVRGQNVQQEANILGANTALRGQDLSAVTGDADRNLAAQQLGLQGQLGFGQLQNQATGMGLQALGQANQQALLGEGMAQDATNAWRQNATNLSIANNNADAGIYQQNLANQAQPSFGERAALAGIGSLGSMGGGLLSVMLSDERAKTDISPLDAIGEHLRGAPGYRYRYKEGFGEDPGIEHAGPMAQDLERGPFGKALVKTGNDGLRRVDVGRLSLVNHAALSSMRSELDLLKEELAA